MKRLPTFICNNVIKNPEVERFMSEYEAPWAVDRPACFFYRTKLANFYTI